MDSAQPAAGADDAVDGGLGAAVGSVEPAIRVVGIEPVVAQHRLAGLALNRADAELLPPVELGDPPRAAPDLAGIVGAPKAGSPWFSYSMALRTAGGTWTEDDLDAYLANARAFAPGTRKSIRINDAEQRAAIIDFLNTQSD